MIVFMPLIFFSVCSLSGYYLSKELRRDRQLVPLIGLFFLAMGVFLLAVDLILITFIHGPQYIPDYLLFNRLVSDSGFSGRWMLTVYVFVGTGICITIYLFARNILKKFNTKETG